MELSANGVRVAIEPLGPVNGEDWGRVTVDVSDAGFTAQFVAFVQSADVACFADELAVLCRDVGIPG